MAHFMVLVVLMMFQEAAPNALRCTDNPQSPPAALNVEQPEGVVHHGRAATGLDGRGHPGSLRVPLIDTAVPRPRLEGCHVAVDVCHIQGCVTRASPRLAPVQAVSRSTELQ